MHLNLIILALLWTYPGHHVSTSENLIGAWKNDKAVIVFTDHYFSYTEYTSTAFEFTYGGSWETSNDELTFSYEYHTKSTEKVGSKTSHPVDISANTMTLDGSHFTRIDDGTPGALAGAWLFNNRVRDGQLGTPREANNPRKTMKILSGTRFQWIAYNTETKEFSGTGGGTYTTVDGKYVENIDFFSRDNDRVGASLEFDYAIKTDEWHHQGLSSRGDPIYEIWKMRKME